MTFYFKADPIFEEVYFATVEGAFTAVWGRATPVLGDWADTPCFVPFIFGTPNLECVAVLLPV